MYENSYSSVTSIEAAESIEHIRYALQKSIWNHLKLNGPCIHQQLEEHYADRYGPSTIRARCAELVHLGWVRDTGLYGLTRAKRRAIVWEAL